jgi:hypothetical protein
VVKKGVVVIEFGGDTRLEEENCFGIPIGLLEEIGIPEDGFDKPPEMGIGTPPLPGETGLFTLEETVFT